MLAALGGFAGIIEIINGILKFPAAVRSLIILLQKTPVEQHNDLVAGLQKKFDTYEQTGRPSWD